MIKSDFTEDIIKIKQVNSAFLTLEEYKELKNRLNEHYLTNSKDIYKANIMANNSFEIEKGIKIIPESPYSFYTIKDEKNPIFILNKPLNVSTNDLTLIETERLHESGGGMYYYEYNDNKYIQRERYDSGFDIWTRDGTTIFPYATQKELKTRLKKHGLKRIYKQKLGDYVRDPFKPTWEEKRSGQGKGWHGESERHSQAAKKGKKSLDMVLWDIAQTFESIREDFLALDAYAQSRMPGSKLQKKEPYTKLQERMEQLKKYEKAYQSEVGKQLRAIDPKAFIPSIESISVPFEITNSETGAVVQGSVLQSFEKNIKQLTPVSSSTVRGVGQFGNELLVQFHPSKGQNMRTYRYMFDDPQQAAQAYQSLTSTGSPGRWIWQNLRGHSAGEPTGIKNVPNKYGPSLSPPGKGTQVIGGTTSSLVDYKISNRTPADRVPNFDEMVKQMKRSTSNPVSDPQTGSPIEESLSQLRPWRDVGMKELMQSTRRQLSQLPKLDLSDEELDARFLKTQKKIQERKECKWVTIRGNPVCIISKKTKFGVDKKLYEEILNETKETGNEKGYLINDKGKTVKFEGTAKSIDPWEVRKIDRELEGKLTFIHSHPNNTTFSPDDIALFILTSKHRTVGVIGSKGIIYELKKPDNIDKYSNNDISKAKQKYRAEQRKADYVPDIFLKEFAKKYNLTFNKEQIKPTKLDFTVIAMGDFTDDYLVETHSKTSKLGKKFMVNEHHRGEGIKASEREWSPEDVKDWTEWEKSLEERHKLAKLGETINPSYPMDENQKKAYLQYIDTKFFTKRNDELLSTCSEKLAISRAIGGSTLKELTLEEVNRIFLIDDAFKELPQSAQDSITEVRIYPNAVDDNLYGDTKDSNIAGFWSPWRKSVTIGMYNFFMGSSSDYNILESPSWLQEIITHEGAHALDDTKLSQKEQRKKRELFEKYKGRLTRHYAGKNEDEFFAEAFTYNYLVRHDKLMKSSHHEKLMETETDINFFINSIIDKYDFLKDMLWEKVEVLKV